MEDKKMTNHIYVVTEEELLNVLWLKGKITEIKFENNQCIIRTQELEEKEK